jgi:hypothetical protein
LRGKLLGHPFFRRYGVNLPSSLTEGRSITLGEFPLPTSVGLRYGQRTVWREAFLGGVGMGDFRALAYARCGCHAQETGISLDLALQATRRPCPFDRLTVPTASPHCS